jgi:hypothetical protein
VSRFLAAARQACESATADLYLAASHLGETTTWERFDAVPPQGVKARDLVWAVRRRAGEEVSELSVMRDILNLSLWKGVVKDPRVGVRPRWTGATGDADEVRVQVEAAQSLMEWLRRHLGGPMPASTHGVRKGIRG